MVPVHVAVLLLTVVNCQSLPQFESGGRILTNNSYIYYANISDGDSALKCVTDSDNCCNDSHVGNWRDERGRAVQQGADEATSLYVTRGHEVVSLNRKNDCIPESSGLWRCDIPDSSEVMQSIYIYISNDATSGVLRMKNLTLTLHTEPNVSPPEFTITYLTEGGPATTLLWRRPNGTIVQQGDSDHETSQIIVDTRNSVYENRLRVKGRESGQWLCSVRNNITDYFHNLRNAILAQLNVDVAEEPTSLFITSQSNSTHVNVTVTWEKPYSWTGYVIYYQAKGGAVSSVMVSGRETERYLLNGLQRGVTYNISIVALSRHLPSPLVGPVTLNPEPILILEVSPSSVTISPNDEFTVTCTARAEVDGQSFPVLMLMAWSRITKSLSGSMNESYVKSSEYVRSGSPESGYQSILNTTENDTVNMTIYRCIVKIPSYPIRTSDVTVTVGDDIMILSLNGIVIPNHDYVMISDIGSTNNTALLCNAKFPVQNNQHHSGGDWYGPNGARVGGVGRSNVPGFVRTRYHMIVRLLRNTATDPPSEGIYHCVVEDDTLTEHTLYVGLYNSGNGDVRIPGTVYLTLNSALSEAIPQFTLTCISTGGPATTVTWTRADSGVIATGNVTVLTNSETAQYIHTLNVTGRLGGLYTCTVGNSKPSSDSANLSIKAANPPLNLTVTTSEESSTISVFWSSPIGGDEVTGYLVYYLHPNRRATMIEKNSEDMSDTFTELTTTQLVYTVSIQALSKHLPSIVVGPVTTRVPGPVQGLVVVSVMERKLNISWEEPAEPNDYTLNYTVTVTDISTATELSKIQDIDKLTILTDVLVKGIPYNVTVFATNGRGNGPNISKIAYAEEDVPRAPRDLTVERVNATHMIVSWTALSLVEARGHIIYYTVNYWPASSREEITTINVPYNITRVKIGDLLSGETYGVLVSASTSVGQGILNVKLPGTPVSSDSDNTATIVGGVLVTVVLAVMMVVIVILLKNCRRRHLTGMKNKTPVKAADIPASTNEAYELFKFSGEAAYENMCASSKKHYPLLKPTNGGADAQYESDVATPHVPNSIPPPPQPTDEDVVYEQVH